MKNTSRATVYLGVRGLRKPRNLFVWIDPQNKELGDKRVSSLKHVRTKVKIPNML
jgi:hypothetical protein